MTASMRPPLMGLLVLSLIVVLIAAVSAAPSSTLWQRVGPVANAESELLRLSIGIRLQRVQEMERRLLDVSTPSSPQYRHYLSRQQVDAITQPTAQSVQAVRDWLSSSAVRILGLDSSSSGDWLHVLLTVADAERLLSTRYSRFRHAHSKVEVMRCDEFQLPDSVRSQIDVIGPTTRFPALQSPIVQSLPALSPAASSLFADPCKNGEITPACIRLIYQFNDASGTGLGTGAVNGFLEQYISLKDLNTFYKQYDASQAGRLPIIVGPNDETQPGVEASLDIQYISALAHNASLTFWYTPGRQPKNPENEPFLVWLSDLANVTSPPSVISTSYGDDEPSVDFDYAVRVNTEFAKAGARGVSILFSSGDGGVAGGQSQQCTTFIPTYPASSPWVTAVGATYLLSSNPVNETSASFSSGGFSDYFPRPDYQVQAVDDYFSKYGHDFPSDTLYNHTGRGFPDVAAVGVNFPIVVNGQTFNVAGTSCSSPTFAALLVVANDLLLQSGQPPLGFLNPLVYDMGAAFFNDITTGHNPGCGTEGFYAAENWDPVTGWGTPVRLASAAAVLRSALPPLTLSALLL